MEERRLLAAVGVDDAYSLLQDDPLEVGASGVLVNDQIASGNPLTASLGTPPAHGRLALDADGTFTYTPAPGYSGPDSFSYLLADGLGNADTAVVSLDVVRCEAEAYVSAGPRLASVDPARGALLNGLLGGLLGTGLELSVLDWDALARGHVAAGGVTEALRADLGLASASEALAADATLAQIFSATADAARAGGSTALADLFGVLSLDVGGLTGTIRLGDLLRVDPNDGSLADATLNALDFVTGNVQLFNFENVLTTTSPASVSGAALGLQGAVNSVRLSAQVVEPPVFVSGPAGTSFHTAAARLKLDLDLVDLRPDAAPLVSALLGGLGPLVNVRAGVTLGQVQLYAEVARGQGTIAAVDAISGAVTLQATPGAVDLYLGAVSDAVFFNRAIAIDPAVDLGPGVLGNLEVKVTSALLGATLADVSAGVTARGAALGQAPLASTLTFDGSAPETQTTRSGAAFVANLLGSLASSLEIRLSGALGILDPLLNGTILPALRPIVSNVLAPVLGTVTTGLADPALGMLGVGVGEMDVTVAGVDRDSPPLANDDFAVTPEDSPSTIAVLADDAALPGDAVTVTGVTKPAHGTVVINPDGTLTYTPAPDYHGPDSFTYTISGAEGISTATVTIQVTPVNDAPVAGPDAFGTAEDTPLRVAAPAILGNDADPDGDALTAVLVSGPAHGSLTLNADGSFTYTPAPDYAGPDSFIYAASDGSAVSPPVAVTIAVSAVNDAPLGAGDSYQTTEGVPLSVDEPGVLTNDADPDGDPLTAEIVSGPSHGSVTLHPDGSFTYTPTPGYSGFDGFSYRASDGLSFGEPVAVTIDVGAEPRAELERAAREEADAYIRQQMEEDPHPTDPVKHEEHMALLELVPFEEATHIAILSGDWSDPDTWMGRQVPGDGSRVWIMPNRIVTVDSEIQDDLDWIRATGTLRFAPDRDTQVRVDTLVVDTDGTFEMGTAARPIQADKVARVVFVPDGPLDRSHDPLLLGRGLIAHGKTSIHGAAETPWTSLAQAPKAGDTTLRLVAAPAGWRPGDVLVLPGTEYSGTAARRDERLTVASVEGDLVRLTAPLAYDHPVPTPEALAATYGQAPPGAPLAAQVANVTRNARFESADPGTIANRGHVMVMHAAAADIRYAGFYGLGRTDKSIPLGPDNPAGRYALHVHRTGSAAAAAQIVGCVVDGSPGWGIVNHSSHVDVSGGVAVDVVGSGFVSEAGDERGSFRDSFSIHNRGSGSADIYHNEAMGGEGFAGHGFWLQSPSVALTGNVVAGAASYGIVYYPVDLEGKGLRLFDVQLAEDRDNTIYASRRGLRVYNSNPIGGAVNRVEGLTTWGLRYGGFGVDYSSRFEVVGSRLIGGNPRGYNDAGAVYLDNGAGFSFRDSYVVGFDTGLVGGSAGRNELSNNYLNNKIDIVIDKNLNPVAFTDNGLREVVMEGNRLAGGGIRLGAPSQVWNGVVWPWFVPERLLWEGRPLFYDQQGANAVVRGTGVSSIDGKTNGVLASSYGIAFAGAIAPSDAVAMPGLSGGVVGSADDDLFAALRDPSKYRDFVAQVIRRVDAIIRGQ